MGTAREEIEAFAECGPEAGVLGSSAGRDRTFSKSNPSFHDAAALHGVALNRVVFFNGIRSSAGPADVFRSSL